MTTSDKETNKANNTDIGDDDDQPDVPRSTETFTTGNIATPITELTTVNIPSRRRPGRTIFGVDAQVRLNHTFDGDLDMFLVAPGGAPLVELSTDNGGSGDNYGNGSNDCTATQTVFNDASGDLDHRRCRSVRRHRSAPRARSRIERRPTERPMDPADHR